MKVIQKLNIQQHAETIPEAGIRWVEPRGIMSAVHVEVRPGFFVHAALGSAGLQIWRGNDRVGIPLQSLMDMAAEMNPVFASVKPPAAGPKGNPSQELGEGPAPSVKSISPKAPPLNPCPLTLSRA